MLNRKIIKERIDKMNAEIKEEDLVRNNYIEMANKLQLSIIGKAKAIEELTNLIQDKKELKEK